MPFLLVISQLLVFIAMYFFSRHVSFEGKKIQRALDDLNKILEKLANPAYILSKNNIKAQQFRAIPRSTEIIYREDEDLADAEAKNRRGRRYVV